MTIYGYARIAMDETFITTQMNALKNYKYDKIYIESLVPDESNSKELNHLLECVEKGDQIVIYDFSVLGKNLTGLAEIITFLEEKEVELILAATNINTDQKQPFSLNEMIHYFSSIEKAVMRENTLRGLDYARKQGKIGGRPTIDQAVIDHIIHLHKNKGYSLKRISEECNISIGSVHKYVQQYKNKHPQE